MLARFVSWKPFKALTIGAVLGPETPRGGHEMMTVGVGVGIGIGVGALLAGP